eukprot:TRINITY_DN4932_c0_g1_i2.p1 TRINITY_DN4932_c0_g1~~TRINITY_DN4932_c0_g1_i2.p1  ORF type:complete len:592 (-),score=133.79 TRINITY_DN4932_c0_g1_i2:238-2013(-)
MNDKERRKAELEEKRKKVQEMRDRKLAKGLTPRPDAGGPSTPATAGVRAGASVTPSVENILSDVGGLLENMSISAKQPEPTKAPVVVAPVSIPTFMERPAPSLESKSFSTVTVAPIVAESYTKGCQTDVYQPEPGEEEDADLDELEAGKSQSDDSPVSEKVEEAPAAAVPELTQAQSKEIMSSMDFQEFVSSSSRVMERALGQMSQYDIMVDYTQADDDAGKNKQQVSLHCQFEDSSVENRIVTDVRWHPTHSEAFYAAYSSKADGGPNDPDGIVLMWSLNMRQRPEYIFTCQSTVHSLVVSEFHPTLVIGGTYSGQIVLWDTRAKSTPVQRTQLSSNGHSHPVQAMTMVGTQNAHNLLSVSTNGRMCSWETNKMAAPKEKPLELKTRPVGAKAATKETDVNVTCIATPEAEFNQFFVGSEDGTVCDCSQHGAKPGVNERFDGHFGPVTGIDFHFGPGPKDFSDFFITSSMDWTVKLWNKKKPGQAIHSFENGSDYVYDVKWSPTHPAVFASVDGSGTLCVWNLNEDYEMPRAQVQMSPHAMNRLQWSPDGTRIITGNTLGKVFVYDVSSEMTQPADSEWARFADVISELS